MPKIRDPLKQKAMAQVKAARSNGTLVRPSACEECGDETPPNKAGQSQIHAHHEDHNKPLDVKWLCYLCHRKVTPIPYGRKIPHAKLTDDLVVWIRASTETATHIARMLGMEKSTIADARRGSSWKHVKARPRLHLTPTQPEPTGGQSNDA